MTKEISIHVTKLDLNFILDNFYKPSLWNKKWTIFSYDNYEITFNLSSIYPKNNSVYFDLILNYKGQRLAEKSVNFNYDKGNRNLVAINNSFNGTVFRLIEDAEDRKIRNRWEYRKAIEVIDNLRDIYREQAEKKIEELYSLNVDLVKEIFDYVKDAYIESQVSKADDYSVCFSIVRGNRGKVYKSLYISYMLFAGMDEKLEQFIKDSNLYAKPTKKLIGEILSTLSKIKKDEFADAVYEELDDVLN